MILKHHIAYDLLMGTTFLTDMVIETFKQLIKEQPVTFTEDNKVLGFMSDMNVYGNVNYWITDTVLEKLDMLKVKKRTVEGAADRYDWTVFQNVRNSKKTFIFNDGTLLRVNVHDTIVHCTHLRAKYNKDTGKFDDVYWVMYYADRRTGEQCEYFESDDVKQLEEFTYKLLCFFYLSENEEIIVQPKAKHGTQKSGKIINTLDVPITIVNSKWNVTSIRTEGFPVVGHFALRWTGPERKIAKMVFIEPFEKHGYVRKAKSESVK